MAAFGVVGQQAPELRVPQWLQNVDGPVRLAEVSEPVVYLFAFQACCPGSRSHGLPTVRALKTAFERAGLADQVKFLAVHTVLEDPDGNTADAARYAMQAHGLADVALGHDAHDPPTVAVDYRTPGTPWTVLIGHAPARRVLFNGVEVDARPMEVAVGHLLDR